MGIIYTKNFHSKALKIYPKWDYWFENIPSGNPAQQVKIERVGGGRNTDFNNR
jgi:hypothetical protein